MNIILAEANEINNGMGVFNDARAQHLRTYLHATPGSTFRLGVINGATGIATVTNCAENGTISFTVNLSEAPLPPWYDLILALPRPRSFKRILFQSAAMGVRNIYVVGAKKVEKSYFSMHLLREEEYRPVLIEGLMQGKTTALPNIIICQKLRDLWDLLPEDNGLRFIANPAQSQPKLTHATGLPIIAIGPDGGWTDAETEAFAQHNFHPITLGPRPLRTDTAAIALPAVIQDRLFIYAQ